MIMKQWVKSEQLKKKTDSICFVNMFKFQEKQFQDCSKEFLGNKNNINKKRFLGKATSHNDHYQSSPFDAYDCMHTCQHMHH